MTTPINPLFLRIAVRKAVRLGGLKGGPAWTAICAACVRAGYMRESLYEQRPGEAAIYWYTPTGRGRRLVRSLSAPAPEPPKAPAPLPVVAGREATVVAYDRANHLWKVRRGTRHLVTFTEADQALAEEFAAAVDAAPEALLTLIAEYTARKAPRKNAKKKAVTP